MNRLLDYVMNRLLDYVMNRLLDYVMNRLLDYIMNKLFYFYSLWHDPRTTHQGRLSGDMTSLYISSCPCLNDHLPYERPL